MRRLSHSGRGARSAGRCRRNGLAHSIFVSPDSMRNRTTGRELTRSALMSVGHWSASSRRRNREERCRHGGDEDCPSLHVDPPPLGQTETYPAFAERQYRYGAVSSGSRCALPRWLPGDRKQRGQAVHRHASREAQARRPSPPSLAASQLAAAWIRLRCVNACGKLPSSSPSGDSSSA